MSGILDEQAADREANKNQALHRERDNLDKDLLQIIRDSQVDETTEGIVINQDLLMQKLVSFCVRRDHKVFDHAYRLGADNGKKKD